MDTFKAMRNFDNFRKQITMKVFLPTWSLLPKCFFEALALTAKMSVDNMKDSRKNTQAAMTVNTDREVKIVGLGSPPAFCP